MTRPDKHVFQQIDPWIDDDPDIKRATDLHPLARYLYIDGLLFIRRYYHEGTIDKCELPSVGRYLPGYKNAAKALVTVGLWIDHGDHWEVRNWAGPWNQSAEQRTTRSHQRRDAGRLGGHKSKHSPQQPGRDCESCRKEGWTSETTS